MMTVMAASDIYVETFFFFAIQLFIVI